MGVFDWITTAIVGALMGLSIAGEDKDIHLCLLALDHGRSNASIAWQVAIRGLCAMRRWIVLPGLMASVLMLITIQGGDALNVCLNAVAVLFLVELDNIFYQIGLGERVRVLIETNGRVVMDEDERKSLSFSKVAHCVIVAGSLLVSLRALGTLLKRVTLDATDEMQTNGALLGSGIFILVAGPFVANWLASMAQVFERAGDPAEIAKRVAINTGSFIAGLITFMVLGQLGGTTM